MADLTDRTVPVELIQGQAHTGPPLGARLHELPDGTQMWVTWEADKSAPEQQPDRLAAVVAYWPHTPGEWQVAMTCEAEMRRFERAMDDLLHTPGGVSAEQAREAGEALLKLAAGAKSATVHIPAGVWPAPDEPFLQPDYIPAPVNGVPGEPIALMRREGGTG